jgi:hypothetical protein
VYRFVFLLNPFALSLWCLVFCGVWSLLHVGKLTWLQWFRQEMFVFGTWIVRNRMRTLKYSGHITGETRALMEKCTAWDMKLYKYARRKLGRDSSSSGGLYQNYNSWLLMEIVPMVAVMVLVCGLYCRWMKGNRGRETGGGGGVDIP